jgi:hypothetical protein
MTLVKIIESLLFYSAKLIVINILAEKCSNFAAKKKLS